MSYKRIPVDCSLVDGRLRQVIDGDNSYFEHCIHGIKLRWSCDECEEYKDPEPSPTYTREQAEMVIIDFFDNIRPDEVSELRNFLGITQLQWAHDGIGQLADRLMQPKETN